MLLVYDELGKKSLGNLEMEMLYKNCIINIACLSNLHFIAMDLSINLIPRENLKIFKTLEKF